jgi:hypothetical protein
MEFLVGLLKLVGGWRAAIFLSLALGLFSSTWYYKHQAADRAKDLVVQKADYELRLGQLELEKQKLVLDLADAKADGEVAVKTIQEKEVEAARKLADKQKEWERRYANDKESKEWANTPIPANVLNGL